MTLVSITQNMISQENKQPLIVILGPTASGKTKLAVNLASKINGEIISADSRQVYRGMTIGTGKDYEEYAPFFEKNDNFPSGIAGVHLIDVVEAGESYNVAFFQNDFVKAKNDIVFRNKIPILCGGTGMYIEAVLRKYENTQVPVNQALRTILEQKTDEELIGLFQENCKKSNLNVILSNADISTRKRLIRAIEIGEFQTQTTENEIESKKITPISDFIFHLFGITIPVENRRERITKRLQERLQNGMIEEVKKLLESGISPEKLIFYGLEYKFITEYLTGILTYDEMVKRLEIAIHQFAKRQMTFFRSMERKGLKIKWLDGLQSVEDLSKQVIDFIKNDRNDA